MSTTLKFDRRIAQAARREMREHAVAWRISRMRVQVLEMERQLSLARTWRDIALNREEAVAKQFRGAAVGGKEKAKHNPVAEQTPPHPE